MKKTLIAIAVLIVGASSYAQVAKTSKAMKQYGPVSLTAGRVAQAAFGKEVVEITQNGTDLELTLTKLGTYKDASSVVAGNNIKNKATGPSTIPVLYLEKGGAQTDWATITAGGISIIGFKSKTVFVLVEDAAGIERIYAYQIGTSTKDCKVLGSTSNIPLNELVGATTDGKSLWIEAANTTAGVPLSVMMFDKKLNGLYDAGGKGKNKVYNSKTIFATGGATVTLPTPKEQYTQSNDGANSYSSYK